MQTKVVEYTSAGDFQKDANKLARDGWTVAAQSERTPKRGCLRMLAGGFLFFRPKPRIVVTYNRQ